MSTILKTPAYYGTVTLYSVEHNTSWEANRCSASKEIPAFYGTRRFITAFI